MLIIKVGQWIRNDFNFYELQDETTDNSNSNANTRQQQMPDVDITLRQLQPREDNQPDKTSIQFYLKVHNLFIGYVPQTMNNLKMCGKTLLLV